MGADLALPAALLAAIVLLAAALAGIAYWLGESRNEQRWLRLAATRSQSMADGLTAPLADDPFEGDRVRAPADAPAAVPEAKPPGDR